MVIWDVDYEGIISWKIFKDEDKAKEYLDKAIKVNTHSDVNISISEEEIE